MSQESRLQHLGLWHLRDKPEELQAALQKQLKESLEKQGLEELPDGTIVRKQEFAERDRRAREEFEKKKLKKERRQKKKDLRMAMLFLPIWLPVALLVWLLRLCLAVFK